MYTDYTGSCEVRYTEYIRVEEVRYTDYTGSREVRYTEYIRAEEVR